MRTLLLALCLLALPLTAAERVISLAPSLSEIMLDLDAADLLVGVLVAAIAAKGGIDILRDARTASREPEDPIP